MIRGRNCVSEEPSYASSWTRRRAAIRRLCALFGGAATVALMAAVAAGQSAPASRPAGFDAEANERVLILDLKTPLGPLGFKTFNEARISATLRTVLGKDSDVKARVTIGDFVSNHAAYDGLNYYIRSIVPVDANGRDHGQQQWFDMNGSLVRTVPWNAGVKEGTEVVLEGNGRHEIPRQEIPWKNGRIEGIRRTYYADGKVQTETTYVNGTAAGPSRAFDRNGALARECVMKDDKRNGTQTEYWPSEKKPRRVAEYKDNLLQGAVKEYYLSGKLKRQTNYVNDLLQGEERQYDEKGDLTLTRYWLAGELVSKEDYLAKTK